MDCLISSTNFTPTYWNSHTIRDLEKRSIEQFVKENGCYLKGRVLDFGAGKPGTCAKPQPYKEYISGEYWPMDKDDVFPGGQFDAILCTQVLQYLPDFVEAFNMFAHWLKPGGHLVITYPTNWDEVESTDLFRFTQAGMTRLIEYSGLVILKHDRRAQIELGNFKFPLGYGVVARKPGIYTQHDADTSAALLTAKLKAKEPFIYVRFGDGAIECINGIGSKTCDGEEYTPALANDLSECWQWLMEDRTGTVYLGDWLSASFNEKREGEYAVEYTKMVGSRVGAWLHYEALLFMRQSQHLTDFYTALKNDPRKKVYIGPTEMAPVVNLLKCQLHIVTPMKRLYEVLESIDGNLYSSDADIILYGAGMAGNIPIIKHWKQHSEKTYIHLGSALDPLYRGKTRKTQLSQAQVRQMLNGLL